MIERLAHYNVLGRIGAGGMGELYRARDTRHGRTVALRILPAAVRDDPQRRERFEADARRASALSHPNIALLYDTGVDQGELYAAFEFVPGETLKAIVASGPLNPRRAIQLAAQIADALADAHAHGIAHGGLTLDRVIVTPKGAAKVLDVGLAAWCGGAAAATADPDPRSDVRSLAALLDAMLRGPSSRGPLTVSPPIEGILERAGRDDRNGYDSAATFAADLRAADEALAARADLSNGSADVPRPRISRRRRRAWGAAVASFLVVAFAIGGWLARDVVRRWSRRVVAPAPKPVLVVAPFTPQDPSRGYVGAGFAADVAASLGQVPGLQVVGRGAAADLSAASAAELARRAGAGAVLSGTIGTPGTRLHAVLKLTDQASGDLLWQDEYEREVNEVFPLRRQITVDVAQAMGVRVGPTAAAEREAARLVDAAAYDAYLRGQAAVHDGRFETAAESFAAALKLDDGLAEAHAAYAGALYRRAPADATAADANRPLIDRAAARAMELAPDLPAANLSAALAAHTLADAVAALKAAIRFDPSYTAAYRELAAEIDDLDPERARRIRDRAAMLDGRERVEDAAAHAQTPDACETLVAAANTGDRRATAAARQRLAAAVDRGGRRDAGPSVSRCAVLAAAALGQAAVAGTLLERIASDPASFRVWAANARGVSRLPRLRETIFPWSRVNGEPSFVRARDALEQSYDRARAQVASALQDLQF